VKHPETHVLLDLDGTLTDSELGIGRSLVHAFTDCGYPIPDDDTIRSMIGPPFEQTLPEHGVDVHDLERVIDAYREHYEEVGLFENRLYDGIVEMIEGLRSAGHTLTLATAKPEHLAVRITAHFGLSGHFRTEVGSSAEVGSDRRTKGEVIREAFRRLAIGPHDRIALDHVVMIGDRDHDVEGAHLNAIDCIGVSWGYGSRDELERAGARVIVDSPSEVVGAVASTYRSRES
jgi:phosphoglycolate phosphatase